MCIRDRDSDVQEEGESYDDDQGESQDNGVSGYADLRLEMDTWETLELRVDAANSDHHRLFLEIQTVWDELHSWDKALRLDTLNLHLEEESLYDLLGPMLRWEDEFHTHFSNDSWLRRGTRLPLPKLVSVKSLTVTASEDIDL